MEKRFEMARLKTLHKLCVMYKQKLYITKAMKLLGFAESETLEDWFFKLELPDLQVDIATNTIEYSEKTLENIKSKIIAFEQSNQPKERKQFKLNQQQIEAVKHIRGPVLVIAGAGSGKTLTLSYRVANLVAHGISPINILLLTFTRKSAKEMLSRASEIAKIDLEEVMGGTFHSFANLILRRYAKKVGLTSSFTIIDQASAQDTLALLVANLGLDSDKDLRFPKKSSVLDIISKSRNKGVPISTIILDEYPQHSTHGDTIGKLYGIYQDYKKENNLCDYDDLLSHLKLLLETDPQVRKRVASIYQFIMVDEYQDTNKMQADLVYWLAKEHENVMVVGDDAQSIYGFRGANFKNILNFRDYFPKYKEIKLEVSYRCSQPILDLANAILKPARNVTPRIMQASDMNKSSSKPAYWRCNDLSTEANKIVSQILLLRSSYSLSFHQMAVLVRNAYHAREVERQCTKKRIPYIFYGGRKWGELTHIQDIISFMRILYNVTDKVAWQRVLTLLPGIGNKTAFKIIKNLEENSFSFSTLTSSYYVSKSYFSNLASLSNTLVKTSGEKLSLSSKVAELVKYYEPFLDQKKNQASRKADLVYLQSKAKEFKTMGDFLTDLALTPPNEKIETKGNTFFEDERPLTISTIHSAKGLEWDAVFICRVIDGEIPSDKSILLPEQLEEERRLFYVAITRAKDFLYLSAPQQTGYARNYFMRDNINYIEESRFLTELENISSLLKSETFIY